MNLIILKKVREVTGMSRVVMPFVTILCMKLTMVVVVAGVATIPTTLTSVIGSTFAKDTLTKKTIKSVFMTVRGNITEKVFSGRSKLNDTPVTTTTTEAGRPIHRKLISVAKAFVSAVMVYAVAKLSVIVTNS